MSQNRQAEAPENAKFSRDKDTQIPLRRALISVYDKTGLEDLVRALHAGGVEIISTGSTAAKIAALGVPVTPVEQVTGFPECLDGRVKTLHPHIHAGILADRRKPEHVAQLEDLGVKAFDLVVCNLYPFVETVASGADFDGCVEQIDIGGPSMVRAAAKNHASVAVVTDPTHYPAVISAVEDGGFDLDERRILAGAAFETTAHYDAAVSGWFLEQILGSAADDDEEGCGGDCENCSCGCDDEASARPSPDRLEGEEEELEDFDTTLPLMELTPYLQTQSLRYGENPHQKAAVYRDPGVGADEDGEVPPVAFDREEMLQAGASEEEIQLAARRAATDPQAAPLPGIANALQLHAKAMSYNNYTDGDAALRAAYDHAEPCVAIIKHANPCGIAVGADVAEAHRKAHACDPVSAFGGVIAVNRPVSVELARQIVPIFTEVVLAPAYEEGALEVLAEKKNLRVLRVTPLPRGEEGGPEFKQISGGLLMQQRDDVAEEGDDPAGWTLACGPAADEETLRDLRFAWRAVRAAKSNAVLLAKDGAAVGVGMGQVNRVDSCRLAIERANTLGGRSTGDAAADKQADVAGGARAEDLLDAAPPRRSAGAVAASDAFFPFADGPQLLIDAGVKAIVQPGGSIRDEETIAACQAAGITMYLTGTRHFYH